MFKSLYIKIDRKESNQGFENTAFELLFLD